MNSKPDPSTLSTSRAQRLRHKYKLSIEDYDAKLAEQGGTCGICGRTKSPYSPRLSVDHDHRCCPTRGKSCGACVRGLLCGGCNGFLGTLERLVDPLDFRYTAGCDDFHHRVATYLRQYDRVYPRRTELWASVEQLISVLLAPGDGARLAMAASLRQQGYGRGNGPA